MEHWRPRSSDDLGKHRAPYKREIAILQPFELHVAGLFNTKMKRNGHQQFTSGNVQGYIA